MTVKIPFSAIVRCFICHWPFRFGSGFWYREKPFLIGSGATVPARGRAICYRCHRTHQGGHWDARIEEEALLALGEPLPLRSSRDERRPSKPRRLA